MLLKLTAVAALGVSWCLQVAPASAQSCLQCPTDAQSSAIGDAFDVFVVRNGVTNRVSGQLVGSCETLILNANVSYNGNGTGGGIGAGFTAGTGHYILLKRGPSFIAQLLTDCTPADMATTLVTLINQPDSCIPPGGTTAVNVKPFNPFSYTLTPADIAAGSLQFEFEYTNGTVLHPNVNNQCVDRVSATPQVNIFISAPPTCTVAPAQSVCPGSPASFTVTATNATGDDGPYTFSWTGPNGFTAGNTNQIFINSAQAANAGYYVATVRDQFGCLTTCSNLLTVFTNPIVNVSSTAICSNLGPATICATLANSNAVGLVTYSWSNGSNSPCISVNPAATTTYTVTVTASTGCKGTNSGTVTVNPNPVVTVSSTAICSNHGPATICATYNTNVAGTGVAYLWAPGGATTACISVTPTVTTTYTVTVTTTNNCTGTASGTVTVNPNPVVTVSSAVICSNVGPATICASYNTNVIGTGVSYLWAPGGATTACISVNPTVTTTYSVTVTATNTGCLGTGNGTVTVNPNPVVTVSSTAICSNLGPATICASYNTNVIGTGVSYLWSPGGATTACISVNPSVTTTYSVTVTATNTGCLGTGNGTVTVNPNPVVTVSSAAICSNLGPTTICASYNTNVIGTGVSYLWSPGGATTACISVNPSVTTTYSVTVTATNTGCFGTGNGTVKVNPNPTCIVTGPTPVCEGSTNVYTSTVTPNDGSVSQSWTITGNGTIIGSTTGPSVTVAAGLAASGTGYTLVDALITTNGCIGGCTNTFQIGPGRPRLAVFKQVVCWTNTCEQFNPDLTQQKSALGVRVDPANCPSFCYRVVVANTGDTILTNVVVTDNQLGSIFTSFTLAPGASATNTVSNVTHCANTVNIVTATATGPICQGSGGGTIGTTNLVATDTNTVTVVPLNIACSVLVSTDGVTFVQAPASGALVFPLNTSYCVRLIVTNTGSFALGNVTATSTGNGAWCFGASTNLGTIAVNGSATVTCCGILCSTVGPTNTYAVSVSAQASQSGTHVCAYNSNGVPITASSSCQNLVTCQGTPAIKLYKQVVCWTNICESFNPDLTQQKSALAVRVDPNNCPSFCYRFVVVNTGNIPLTNVVVSDNQLGTIALVGTLAVGGSATNTVSNVTHCNNTVNIATATGIGLVVDSQTQTVTASDTNSVTVVPISVACTVLVSTDGVNYVPAPASGALVFPVNTTYCVRLIVTNTGSFALGNVTATSTGNGAWCFGATTNMGTIAVNGSATVTCCGISCSSVGPTNTYAVSVSAQASQSGTHVCAYNSNGVPITASSSCQNSVTCQCTPAIKVYKQVVCWTNICEQFNPDLTQQKFALGTRVDSTQCPAFCYRIIVTNLGTCPLSNVTVTDDHLNLISCFPTPFTLAPAGQPNSSASCIVSDVTHCDNTTNIVTASGSATVVDSQSQTVTATDTNAVVIVPISVACTLQVITNGTPPPCSSPNNCTPVLVGTSYTVQIVVTNNGAYPLQNVIVTSTGSTPLCFGTTNIGNLAVGGIATVSCTTNCPSTPGENDYAVSVSAQTSQSAGHVCAYTSNGVPVTASSQCSTCVYCCGVPHICVTKAIACYFGTNSQGADVCGTFGPSAIGVQGDTQQPAFCYSITVSNCGDVGLVGVTVIDDKYGDLTADFPCVAGVFAAHASCTFEFKAELAEGPNNTIGSTTNTVTAAGCSVFNTNQCVNASASAVGTVIPASVSCAVEVSLDGGAPTNGCVRITDGLTHTLVWYLTIHNTGIANLDSVTVEDDTLNLPCSLAGLTFSLDEGASITVPICTNSSFVCSNASSSVNGTLTVVATEFSYTTNHISLCAHDLSGSSVTNSTNFSNIFVRSQCPWCVACVQPNACRVTGGGRQDLSDANGSVCPTDVRYVTHGGQVGAPVGNKVCSIDTSLPNYWLGNPCIHGRWTHVRHQQGGDEGNFHARFFDTLDCACLDTNLDANCMYGPETVVDGVCGDRSTGPLPRKAPANKIVFTGVGDWTCEPGKRAPRSCLFRVDIEDRGEPGNAHALSSNGKANRVPDRYRIRIWVLTDAELAQLNSAGGADPYLIHFRDCIGACNGINYQDGVCGPNTCSGSDCDGSGTTGTITFPGGCPVRSPNVDDGGELLHGNHQIHPSIMACDPANPKGPGLAKP